MTTLIVGVMMVARSRLGFLAQCSRAPCRTCRKPPETSGANETSDRSVDSRGLVENDQSGVASRSAVQNCSGLVR